MSKLQEIEKEISTYVNLDKSNWTRIYRLMDEVDRDKLYLERTDTPSFTSWVNVLAGTLGVHVSLLWSRKKAGKVYEEYHQRAIEIGRMVPDLEDINASPDSICLCEKIAGKNAVEMDHLIEKVLDGDLTRADLRQAAKAKRALSVDAPVTSRHNRINVEDRIETDERVTAADIILALRRSSWLEVKKEDPHFQHVYHLFQEFRVDTGTSHNARRLDALIAETFTEKERDHITLRGFEIKVDLHDLESDHKMAEYTDFVDYFYICIPAGDNNMLSMAESISCQEWGIMTVSKSGVIKIVREPKKLEALFRDKALTTALIKSISE